jgi:hypothetical protein
MKECLLGGTLSVSPRSELEEARLHGSPLRRRRSPRGRSAPGSLRLCLEPRLTSLLPGHERIGRYSRATPADASSMRRPATSSIPAPCSPGPSARQTAFRSTPASANRSRRPPPDLDRELSRRALSASARPEPAGRGLRPGAPPRAPPPRRADRCRRPKPPGQESPGLSAAQQANNGQPQDEAIGHRPLRRSVAPQRRCLLSWARGTVVSR